MSVRVKEIRTRIPSSPLPTEDEVPLIPESLLKRFPELVDYNDELRAFHGKLRTFILEQDRLLNEHLTEEPTNG